MPYIRKCLLLYLVVVMLITMASYSFIYIDITHNVASIDFGDSLSKSGDESLPPAGLELRLLVVLICGLVVCAVFGYLWLGFVARRMGRPVRTISKAISKLAKGQLNETVTINTSDEFEQIGTSLNELAANLQELLLYIWKQSGQCQALLDQIHSNPDLQHDKRLTLESLGYLKQLSEAIDNLRDMAKAYVFFDVTIEGAKTRAIDQLDNSPKNEKSSKDINSLSSP